MHSPASGSKDAGSGALAPAAPEAPAAAPAAPVVMLAAPVALLAAPVAASKPVDRQTLSYQYGAHTPSDTRGPAGHDSIAALNGTCSAAHSARSPASGAASKSEESMT